MNRIDRTVSEILKATSSKYDVNPVTPTTPVKSAIWSTIKYGLGGQADRDDLYRILAAQGFVDGNFDVIMREMVAEGAIEEMTGAEGIQYVIPGWDIREIGKQGPTPSEAAGKYPTDEQYNKLMEEILAGMTPKAIMALPGVYPALSEALMDRITGKHRGNIL